jgi:hypothetical protein
LQQVEQSQQSERNDGAKPTSIRIDAYGAGSKILMSSNWLPGAGRPGDVTSSLSGRRKDCRTGVSLLPR